MTRSVGRAERRRGDGRRLSPGIVAAVALAFVLGAAAASAYHRHIAQRDAPRHSFAATQRGHLERLDRSSAPGRVVFLGSSTFQALDVSAVTPIGLNLSIGGDTLPALLERASGYRSLRAARAAVINIGLNDIVRGCAPPQTPVSSLLDRVPAAAPVVVVGVQDVVERGELRCGGALPGLVADFNAQTETACNGRPSCLYVPHPASATPTDARGRLFEPDGIHLTAAGYALLIESLRAALAKAGAPTTGV